MSPMSSKPTTILSFHHNCYTTRSLRVYVFKTHHNLKFSPQMMQDIFNEIYVFQTHHMFQFSPQIPSSKTNEPYVFQTHHNLQFPPQMLNDNIIESLGLQNPSQFSVFTTNSTPQDHKESISTKPTTIFSFHHKCYQTKPMSPMSSKPTTIFSFHHKFCTPRS